MRIALFSADGHAAELYGERPRDGAQSAEECFGSDYRTKLPEWVVPTAVVTVVFIVAGLFGASTIQNMLLIG